MNNNKENKIEYFDMRDYYPSDNAQYCNKTWRQTKAKKRKLSYFKKINTNNNNT